MGRLLLASLVLVALLTGCAPQILQPLPNPVFGQPQQLIPSPPQVEVPPPTEPIDPKPGWPLRPIGPVTILVDAGHGGRDPGAQGRCAIPEKTFNLQMVRQVASLLEQRGAKVILTRNDDRFVELDDRAALAERYRADLFVSIHADANDDSQVRGATMYISRKASSFSIKTAEKLVAAFDQAGIEVRGVRRAGFRVLKGHSRPAVLIECGFMTNHQEARLLVRRDYQAKLAQAIVNGIAAAFGA